MRNSLKPLLAFETLPFHIGTMPTSSNGDFPDTLPFTLGEDEQSGLLVQMPDSRISSILEKVYTKGTIVGTPMSDAGIGRGYADDFLRFFDSVAGERRDGHVLEVGCGTGYLLSRIQALGFSVLGFEPGAQGQEGARRYGVDIVRDFFPGQSAHRARRAYDFILHFAVLEHVQDPVGFLQSQAGYLETGAPIVIAVPDCTPYIETGDISMLVHEHWNYFTAASLAGVMRKAGLRPWRVERSGFGGLLYALGAAEGDEAAVPPAQGLENIFKERAAQSAERFGAYLERTLSAARSIGIYCPARAINILHTLKAGVGLRFFDDDPNLHGRCYPPFAIQVESRDNLRENPTDEVVIMSRSFGEKIRTSLRQDEHLPRLEIRLFDDIID